MAVTGLTAGPEADYYTDGQEDYVREPGRDNSGHYTLAQGLKYGRGTVVKQGNADTDAETKDK